MHEGVKFPCNQCDYKATQKSNLLKHIKSIHDCVKLTKKVSSIHLEDLNPEKTCKVSKKEKRKAENQNDQNNDLEEDDNKRDIKGDANTKKMALKMVFRHLSYCYLTVYIYTYMVLEYGKTL